jgi:anaerobic C4-dicarboxylate transporter-like protein
MFWIELTIVLVCIIIGTRLSGVGIGLAGGMGLVLLVFGCKLQPSSPPIDVMLIIMAIITMVSTMYATGGMDFLVSLAEKILRKHPDRITLVAPLVTYCFSLFCGSSYVAFSLYPVIAEVAYEAKVRPERPLSIAAVAGTQAVTASPMSAAMAVLVTMVGSHITLARILMVCVPAGLCGVLAGVLSVYHRGLELEDDPEYLKRMAAGEIAPPRHQERAVATRYAKLSVLFFACSVIAIVLLGSYPSLLPSWRVAGRQTSLSIPNALEMVMLCSGLITVLVCKVKPANIINNSIFTTGMMAVVSIFGIAWMVDTFFSAHGAMVISSLGRLVQSHPYSFALALMLMAALLMSQGAAMRAIGPLGLSLGVSPAHMVGMFHGASAINIIPGTGAVIGVVSFDRTGTTTIGKYVFDHSFLRPGLVSVITSVIVGYLLALVIL